MKGLYRFLSFLVVSSLHIIVLKAYTMTDDQLLALSLEELIFLEVTSVSHKKERFIDTAAAIYVITQQDIRRSGVNTIPEALKMVPGLHVRHMNNNTWSISARGFNYIFTNKLLIMMDGRALDTPAFTGSNWDMQDTLIEDIDRIEVIRGPGAAAWGANAVSGVINIITKNARAAQGSHIALSTGNRDKLNTHLRHAGKINADTFYHVFFKSLRTSSFIGNENDSWRMDRVGVRIDGQSDGGSEFLVQANVYDGSTLSPLTMVNKKTQEVTSYLNREREQKGGHILLGVDKGVGDHVDVSLKLYYDTYFNQDYRVDTHRDVIDIDSQYRYRLTENQEVIAGLGYRMSRYKLKNFYSLYVENSQPEERLLSSYLQYEITFLENFHLNISARLESDESTSDQKFQPNAKLSWSIDPRSTAWISLSQAERTPAITERDFLLQGISSPVFNDSLSGLDFDGALMLKSHQQATSEKLTAFELGYRYQISESMSIDAVTFINNYKDLLSIADYTACPASNNKIETALGLVCQVSTGYVLIPALLANSLEAKTYGFEITMNWDIKDWWRVEADIGVLRVESWDKSEHSFSQDVDSYIDGLNSDYGFNVRSMMEFNNRWFLDVWLKHNDAVKSLEIDHTTSVSLQLSKRFSEYVDCSMFIKKGFGGYSGNNNEDVFRLKLQWYY